MRRHFARWRCSSAAFVSRERSCLLMASPQLFKSRRTSRSFHDTNHLSQGILADLLKDLYSMSLSSSSNWMLRGKSRIVGR
jgi:hypothetical protein